ncbi:MAG: hypothetical protein LUD46_13935 [Parabacteroides sp.]|nr:hypothetical protein [Parabacteroides sp.]
MCSSNFPSGKLSGQGIRIVPQKLYVKNDSLHIQIKMDLNEVRTGSGTAFIFTPVMLGKNRQTVTLPLSSSVAAVVPARRSAKPFFPERQSLPFLT